MATALPSEHYTLTIRIRHISVGNYALYMVYTTRGCALVCGHIYVSACVRARVCVGWCVSLNQERPHSLHGEREEYLKLCLAAYWVKLVVSKRSSHGFSCHQSSIEVVQQRGDGTWSCGSVTNFNRDYRRNLKLRSSLQTHRL